MCLQIVEQFQNDVCQIVRTLKISSSAVHDVMKDSGNLKKSLCAKDKDKNQRCMHVIFVPSGNAALKSGMI